jgi:heterodisulfide reductase subunit A
MCCSQAVKNALRFLTLNPEVNIYVLYRDVRTYGFREDFYRKAREAGVIFIRYDNDSKPEIHSSNGKLNISVFEPILREKIELSSDLVVLSTGIEPKKDNDVLAKMLKVPLNDEGFFLEAHVKLRPVDFATEGVFVAGMAHSPKCIDETISQAEAAVARASTIIANKKYYAEAAISHVNEELCVGCGICSGLCPFEAIEIEIEDTKRKSKVNEALCKGCGTCVAACPSGAMEQYGFTKRQIMAMIDNLVE